MHGRWYLALPELARSVAHSDANSVYNVSKRRAHFSLVVDGGVCGDEQPITGLGELQVGKRLFLHCLLAYSK